MTIPKYIIFIIVIVIVIFTLMYININGDNFQNVPDKIVYSNPYNKIIPRKTRNEISDNEIKLYGNPILTKSIVRHNLNDKIILQVTIY
jgi:hypothetical protein